MMTELRAEGISSNGASREGRALTRVSREAGNRWAQHIAASLTIAIGSLYRGIGEGRNCGHKTEDNDLQCLENK